MKFTKNQMKLREDDNQNPDSALNDIAKQADQNPSHKAQAPLSDFNTTDTDNGPKITVDNDNPQSKQFIKNMANNPTLSKTNATVEFTESKVSKPIFESVTFSKAELSDFLRNI